jgi:asparagine synthase (glutamine-hydrolysing)
LQWLIARAARQHITVALSGAGGDELFAGYPRYRAAQLSRVVRRLPEGLLNATQAVLRYLKDDHRTMRLRRIREFLSGMNDDPIEEFTNWTYFLDTNDKTHLLREHPGVKHRKSSRILQRYYEHSPLAGGNRLLHVDVQTFLVDNLLEYTDRMSMAVSMEVRVPLLEPDFVEYALNVPFRFKLNRRGGKQVFRQAFRRLLAPPIQSAKKRGFNAPLGQWMHGALDEYFIASRSKRHALHEVLGRDLGVTWNDEGILNWECINSLRRDHQEGRADLSHELFAVIVFDTWWRKYVTQSAPIEHWSSNGMTASSGQQGSDPVVALGAAPLTLQ